MIATTTISPTVARFTVDQPKTLITCAVLAPVLSATITLDSCAIIFLYLYYNKVYDSGLFNSLFYNFHEYPSFHLTEWSTLSNLYFVSYVCSIFSIMSIVFLGYRISLFVQRMSFYSFYRNSNSLVAFVAYDHTRQFLNILLTNHYHLRQIYLINKVI